MLRRGPWCRLPLTVRWLKQDYQVEFTASEQPPIHMPILYGPVDIQKSTPEYGSQTEYGSQAVATCNICKQEVGNIPPAIECIVATLLAMFPDVPLHHHYIIITSLHLTCILGKCPVADDNALLSSWLPSQLSWSVSGQGTVQRRRPYSPH